jgi:PTS system N-acetylgalactosamine-specific IIC component
VSPLALDAAGAAALALLELDEASVGPLLLSRPFVVAPAIGAALGSPWSGAVLGAVFELVTLSELPLGGRLDLSAPVAAGVAAFLAAGPAALPLAAAFPAGLAAGWAHARVERVLRRRRGAAARRAEAALAAGRPPRLGRELAGALAAQAAAVFVLALAVFALAGPALSSVWPRLPETVRAGADAAFGAAPWLGAGGLAASLWRTA